MEFECIDSIGRDIFLEREESVKRDWSEESSKDGPTELDARRLYQILLFGSTAKGESVCIQVEGYRPAFLVRLPADRPVASTIRSMSAWILESIHPSACSRVTFTHERHKTLWDYNGEALSDFLRIDFPSLGLWRRCKDKFVDKDSNPIELSSYKLLGVTGPKVTFQIYEANLDPLLRFFHQRDLSPAGWMSLRDFETSETDEAKTAFSFVCQWDQVAPVVRPLHAPLLIASWDIECMSAHGDFPLPKKTWRKPARELLEAATPTYEAACRAIADTFRTGAPLSSFHLRDRGAARPSTAAAVDEFLTECSREFGAALCSSDIETATDTLEKLLTSFMPPMAGDPIIQIGVVLYRQGAPVKKYIWVLGGCDREAVKPPGGDVPIDVYIFSEEAALLRSWSKWVETTDPDVLVGYNVFGFDERFVWDRAKELKIESCLKSWNRLTSTKPALDKKELSSAAMGDNTMYVLKSTGRLQIDLLHYIRKNYPLDSYTLDNVSATFVSGAVVGPLKAEKPTEFRFATKSTKGMAIGRYITLLDEENDRVVDRCEVLVVEAKGLVVRIEGGTAVLEEHGAAAVRWAQVKDDISPQQIFESHRGTDKDRAMIARYCLNDCDLVMELFQKLDVLNNAIAMANVCSVPVGYIFTRGQGIKIESLMFKEARKDDKLIHVLSIPARDGGGGAEDADDPSYEGAIVLDPKTGIYIDDPVTVLDFASLYPSTIISENISHDTLIWVKEYNLKGDFVRIVEGSDAFDNLSGASYVNIEFDLLIPDSDSRLKHKPKVKQGMRIARYIQIPVRGRDTIGNEGTIPKILKMLLSSRKKARKEAEKEPDEFKKALLDAMQLAYKLTANSLYGQLGSATFKVRRQVLAASTTAYGRKQLLFAKDCIEQVYGVDTAAVGCKTAGRDPRCCAEYIYGDSVSADTPVLVRCYGKELSLPIQNLHLIESDGEWIRCEDGKEMYELKECMSWTEIGWTPIYRIIRHRVSKAMYRVYTREGHIDVTEDHSLLNTDGVMITPGEIRIALAHGIDIPLLSTKFPEGDLVRKIDLFEPFEDPVVYDLTTGNHHFQAGPEGLIVHNTDSVFMKFNPKDPATGKRLRGEAALVAAKAITEEAGHLVSGCLKAPHDFEFDKMFRTFCLLSKKRYVGDMTEGDLADFHRKAMGIVMKRRDNAPIVKYVYGGVIDRILDPTLTDSAAGVRSAFTFVQETARALLQEKLPMSKLTITKSLRSEYKSMPAHKMLANRIAERDPGNAPSTTERIPFVYIMPPPGEAPSKLQGDRIETPSYIREKKLKIDYPFYITNQIAKPVAQVFGLEVEKLPGATAAAITAAAAARDPVAAREALAESLLFGKILLEASRVPETMERRGQTSMLKFLK
jgi:DNA polymerase elongation subunit (family B)